MSRYTFYAIALAVTGGFFILNLHSFELHVIIWAIIAAGCYIFGAADAMTFMNESLVEANKKTKAATQAQEDRNESK